METINGSSMNRQQISEYLERLELEYPKDINYETLKSLQYAHITHIPFENLDIMRGKELSVDRDVLFEKIIYGSRGGVCSELNTLYNWLLESIGFDVTSFISRIIAKSAPIQANSHRVMCVKLEEGRYITDVGFNYDHHRVPLLLEENIEQYDGECSYRFSKEEPLGWVMHQKTAEGWRKKISFTESPQIDPDFVAPTFFAQYSPESKINKALKVSIHRGGTFLAIREGVFLTEEKGIVREIKKVDSEKMEGELLEEIFGIRV